MEGYSYLKINIKIIFASFLFFYSHVIIGQIVDNPSLEGMPGESISPNSWFGCNQYSTPDTQPGFWGVKTKASQGKTFVSLVSRGSAGLINDYTVEGIGTKLNNIQDNVCYSFSIDLASANIFFFIDDFGQKIEYVDPIKLSIWGSEQQCEKSTLLWTSPIINHTDWRTYSFNLSGNYKYMMMEATYADGKREYGNVLIDNVIVKEHELNIGADTTLCKGTSIELNVDKFWNSVKWNNGSNQYNIEAKKGNYWVEVNADNCVLKDSITIDYRPPLAVDLGEDVSLCTEDSLVLDVSVPTGVYHWNNGSDEAQIIITDPGIYYVEVYNGCESVFDEITVTKRDKCCEIYAPNVFTPNNDGLNDSFEITTSSNISRYELKIFNKWGRLIFSSSSINNFWDGTIDDKLEASSSVYYWHVKVLCIEKNDIIDDEFNGHVTILK